MDQITYPYITKALAVDQPMGEFYVVKLPAKLLLQVGYSDILNAKSTGDPAHPYELEGTQRELLEKRLTQIGGYIDRADSGFPNSIILAANLRQVDGLVEGFQADDDTAGQPSIRWEIAEEDGEFTLLIPSPKKLAAIIDGQHRLFGFARTKVTERLDMELLCSIYVDLPKPFQAQLFATINSNQKRVDKSLTYELFGYNIEDEEPEYWPPEKLAVFLTRRLGADSESTLKGRISISPRKDATLSNAGAEAAWKVSTAAIVDGILRLISSNPKRDSNELRTPKKQTRNHLESEDARKDRSPLREAFIEQQDAVIYQMVKNFVKACDELLWSKADLERSFIIKTVGVQALFDILRKISSEAYGKKIISVDAFTKLLQPASEIDFASEEFRNASGSGRTVIRKAIEEKITLEISGSSQNQES
ncbi:MAG: DNA phosphorothioation-associated DGQHR protein 1 [Sphingorhabdus sp.]